MIRLLVADDHEVLRAGICRLLADVPDFKVVLDVGSGFEAVDAVRAHEIDVVILDVSMPGNDLATTIGNIRTASPHTRVVVLSAHPAEQYALRALRAGASAYVMKHERWIEVVAAIRKAHAGGLYVTPALSEIMAANMWSSSSTNPGLTDRELQVLQRIASGLSPAAIAEAMNISPKTVHSFRARLLKKLGLRTTADLIRYALEHRLTE